MKIISIANTAGGSGKTTAAHALAVAFVEYGKKTLLIDLDSKSSLTFRLGFEGARLSITDFISGTVLREDYLLSTSERFDFIGSDSRLTGVVDSPALSELLNQLPKDYDLVVLDHASGFTPLLAMSSQLSDLFVIPVKDDLHSLRGALQIKNILNSTPFLSIHIGASNELTPRIDSLIPTLDASIELGEEVELAASTSNSVLTFDKASAVSQSYRSAAYSLLEVLGMD